MTVVDISALTLAEQERVTAAGYRCPACSAPMVGARVWDAHAQEALVGAVCVPCDHTYRIVWADGEAP